MKFTPFLTWDIICSAAVVKLKTLTSALPVDEHLSSSCLERIGFLQKILLDVVSIIYSFMKLHTFGTEKFQFLGSVSRKISTRDASSSDPKRSASETMLLWQQKAIVLVMEAGGVNWLVGKVCFLQFYVHILCIFVSACCFFAPLNLTFTA